MTGRHARPDDIPGHPSRTAVVSTAARLLVAKYDRAVQAAEGDSAALWVYLPDNWIRMAEQLARVLVQESDHAHAAATERAAAGEVGFLCPGCDGEFFRLIYSPARRAAGTPPYRVVCARCQGGAAITESGPADGSHTHRWGPGE